MAFTQEQLDKLIEAIAQGAESVKFQDKEVRFRSLDDMIRLRDLMIKKLGGKAGSIARMTATTCKGLP